MKFRSILNACLAALCATALGVSSFPAQAQDREGVWPLGMCSNGQFFGNPQYPAKLVDAGADMVRLDIAFGSVRRDAEPNPDRWNWKPFEDLRRIRAQHPKLKFLVILGYGAKWAADPKFADVPGPDIASPQRGVDVRPANAPENLYGQYVYEAVRRYGDVVDAWESWNEPDLNGHAFFKGDGAAFMPYQRTFYLAAKQADPKCTTLFAGLCFMSFEGYLAANGLTPPTPYPPKSSFFEEYLGAVKQDPDAAGHGYYFDIMNQHTYSRATDLYDYAAVVRKLMQDHLGAVKPLWITEMGSTDKGGVFGMSADEYCDYMLQSFAWGALGGVEKFFHFQLDNSNDHGLYSGMLGNPKPVLTTYRDVLAAELGKVRFVKQLHGHAGVGFLEGNSAFHGTWRTGYNAFEFHSTDGRRRIVMAFADKAEAIEVAIPATAKSATLVDRHNTRSTIQAVDGTYKVRLAGATNKAGWPSDRKNAAASKLGDPEHLVGGATILIIEQLVADK